MEELEQRFVYLLYIRTKVGYVRSLLLRLFVVRLVVGLQFLAEGP